MEPYGLFPVQEGEYFFQSGRVNALPVHDRWCYFYNCLQNDTQILVEFVLSH